MTAALASRVQVLGPDSAGARLRPGEFDRARFVEGYRYELIDGVLIVSPIPRPSERDPNGELEYLLRLYRDSHPQGSILNGTLPEQTVKIGDNRRRADRVIWAGLGRDPHEDDIPAIIVEFVSQGRRNRRRDYEEKRDEYLDLGVREYWVIDRFDRTLTVFVKQGKTIRKRVVQEKENYKTRLLPGFELPLAKLLAAADKWPEKEPETY